MKFVNNFMNDVYEYYVTCGHTPRKHFLGLIYDCLNRNHNCNDHIFISYVIVRHDHAKLLMLEKSGSHFFWACFTRNVRTAC